MVPAEANSQKTSAMGHFDRLSEGGYRLSFAHPDSAEAGPKH
jgi:hypothetical protein